MLRHATALLSEARAAAVKAISAAGYRERDIRWCLTVPAAWHEDGERALRRAAGDAGLPAGQERLLLCPEPEAAALYCHLWMTGGPAREPLGPGANGSRFVVVHCGGGTVGLAAYETSGDGSGRIALREIGEPAGGHGILVRPREGEELLDRALDGIVVQIRTYLAELGREDGAPLPETLLLVGGFAASPHLRARLRREFGADHRILVPPDPSRAVVEGAVHLAARPEIVIARRSRYTYGFEIALPWEEHRDPPARRIRSGEGEALCAGRFEIAIRRGDDVTAGAPFPYTVSPTQVEQTSVRVRMMRTRDPAPRYADEEGCEQIGELTVDVNGSTGRPLKERVLLLLLSFGPSGVRAEAIDPITGERSQLSTYHHPTR
ncbi:hypothetical protein [Sphaerisporangium krabiense]|uniref:Hsp70 family protein n=1 Tax=Sphaerisporangium krabiense TaxID=763782 RepID=A0A7W9DR40_9ACTN|nr:hypothetical protein [Sphaerisporangium krabiense]MBB5628146.1 hypothetical protein [Sphaerisporangium krabiense]